METPVKQQENRPQPAPVIPTKPPPELKALNHKLFDQHQHRSSDPAILKMIEARQRLPAWDHQKLILDALASHRVIVVEGETGCGKTTQVPQFILDDFITKRRGAECNILVTQPRRISAIGVAERVAAERAEPLGKTVGYQIRLESRMSDQTRILFATTGILLRRLEGAGAKAMDANGSDAKHPSDNYEGGIDDITHIVVDEVHERSVDSDFLLMVLRDLLETNTKLKVVLMSATLNAALFQDYFGGPAVTPRIHIPGRTFPVKVMFLEDALAKTKYIPSDKTLTRPPVFQRGNGRQQRRTDLPSSGTDDSDDGLHRPRKSKAERYPHIPEKAIGSLSVLDVDKIQYPLIEKLVEWMCERLLPGSNRGILIFLPGYAEISTLHDLLTANPLIRSATGSGRFCIPLHGNLSSMDQLRVFKRPDDGAVKIVIATNVAETSITVDDVVCVIDTGKMKETRYDPAKGMASLEECWVSKANAMQRRGRAGRVTEGLCVHLFTSHTFENGLAQQQIPEMRRTPLEQLCLRIKVLPFLRGRIHHILENVIEPPSREAVTNAIMTLRSLQALTREEDLTPLGFHLGRLPVDVRIGKLIVFGSIFQCVDSVLTIAAIMSHKSPFVAPFDKREMADARKRDFALESSDQLTLLNAYNQWSAIKTKGFAAEKKFLFDNFLSGKSLTMIASIKRQLAELLEDIGFLDDGYVQFLRNLERQRGGTGTVDDHHANARGNDFKLVKALLVAALYPNVIKQGPETKPGASAESNLIVKGNEQVFIHPTSINFRRLPPNVMSNRSSTPFLVYHEKVKTSKVFVRDSSLVTSHALAFFGGSVKWDPRQGYLNMEDGWIRFRAQPKVAAVIEGARAALDEVLQRKIQEPTLDISNDPIFDVIVSVVTG
ncbi:P-loop containing nucleoside triphosphate hydrolase protein [Fimicolochytrium jonesii]|uniref:P-loop containing nucleoside triphosphate hydrolase protein n=1 Tax=Fimicolochytrium jonesii TaxID=1396493 RepID=UPI0022FE4443|nr:P-loop containing nucleoside triphosphate hydrolase protein [Fimicolochytrium jonesii]KAI8824273.1 P-loop containing nucleoside triphosphate hydrolase protein [Fimicolochytrium jonesii]